MSQAKAGKLAQDLEDVTVLSLAWIKTILRIPIDIESPAGVLRAQATAANVAINAQLRANALLMRSERSDKVLERLIDLIARKEITIPASETKESCAQSLHSLEHQSDGSLPSS